MEVADVTKPLKVHFLKRDLENSPNYEDRNVKIIISMVVNFLVNFILLISMFILGKVNQMRSPLRQKIRIFDVEGLRKVKQKKNL